MTRVLRRLARTTPSELRFRCLDAAAVAAEAVRFAAGRERWRRDVLRTRLLSGSLDVERARRALHRRDWREAGLALRTHFLQRPARFVIDPAQRETFATAARARFPSSVAEARVRADRLLAGRHNLLGYHDVSFGDGDRIDWHADPIHGRRAPVKFWARVPYLDPATGDHKVIWEVNRHQHWLPLGRAAWLTGDRRYADAVIRELDSWLKANPPLAGINWSSMLEVALRSISWLWALHLLAPLGEESDSEWILDLIIGLDRQLDHVARHLSFYFSPNTHLLGEALALYVAGRVVPELRKAARWERTGRDILIREARAQVHPDGGHAELSTHYHRYALDFYLLALVIARRTADPAAEHFEEVATRMASYCRAVAADDGRLPTIGDDDGGMLFPMCGRSPADARDSLALAAALLRRPELAVGPAPEETFWMLGGESGACDSHAASPAPASHLFPDTGYAVLRARGFHAIVDAGRHGFLNAGHAHADALGLVLSAGGRPLLIDPGTAGYTLDPEVRDRFRSTAMHNTVVVDGKPQAVPAGPFHWSSRADARVTLWRPGAALDCVEADHDGYLPVIHRRAVVRSEDLWLIVDHILGTGRHRAEAYWHFDPAWTLTGCRDADACFVHLDGSHAALATTATERREFHGDDHGFGWSAPVYGRMVPAATLSFSQSAAAPLSLVTALTAAASPVRLSVAANAVTIERQDGWHRSAVTVRCNDARVVALFATPLGIAGPRSVQRVVLPDAELVTDARVAVLWLSGAGEPASLSVIDATTAAWRGSGAFRLPPMESGDLHFDSSALRQLRDAAHVRLVG